MRTYVGIRPLPESLPAACAAALFALALLVPAPAAAQSESAPFGPDRWSSRLELGPVEGLTEGWHRAPKRTGVPSGVVLRFRVRAPRVATVTWSGAREVERTQAWSVAETSAAGPSAGRVSVDYSDPSGERFTEAMDFTPVDTGLHPVTLSPVRVSVQALDLSGEDTNRATTRYFFRDESIAELSEVGPGAFRTSTNRWLTLEVTVEPAELAPLVEWRHDGVPLRHLGSSVRFRAFPPRVHSIAAGPAAAREISLTTYRTVITSHRPSDPIPEGLAVTFTAETDPPGFEDDVMWLASTKFGSCEPLTGRGREFTVRFTDTYGESGRWLGVKADDAKLGRDQKTLPPSAGGFLWEAALTEFVEADPPPMPFLVLETPDGATLLTAEVVGTGNLVEPPAHDEGFNRVDLTFDGEPSADEPPVADTPFSTQALRLFHTGTRLEFEVTLPAGFLRAVHEFREAEGTTGGTLGVDDPAAVEGMFVPPGITGSNGLDDRGWSNASDSRIPRTPATLWPWRTIANLGRCSGTLIGPRHLLTAAHCINKQGTDEFRTFTVTPAQDGPGTAPFGSSAVSLDFEPGDPFRWYFTPAPWRECGLRGEENCSEWDWGLVVLPDRLGEQVGGWMGYVARPGSALEEVDNYNRGYPAFPARCGDEDSPIDNSPAACSPESLCGDLFTCNPGSYANPGPDGWNRNVAVSCDASGGHSGSPVYHYFFDPKLGKVVPVVSMVMIWENCCLCSPTRDFPNVTRRITPEDLGIISFFRQWKP